MQNKIRLDVALTEQGKTESREKAKALIMAGKVYIDNQKADKAGMLVLPDTEIEVRDNSIQFVSRGGLKLDKAIREWGIDLNGKVCSDIGASTGGFTDCMLQNGAIKVYSVDVGYGQLAWKLRTDERVVNLERTNFRNVTEEQIPQKLDFASIDVSFISLKLILPVLKNLLNTESQVICLIKPQFEAGKENVGKNGVVRDKKVHISVIETLLEFMNSIGFNVLKLTYSPIKGPKGNIEYLTLIEPSEDITPYDVDIKTIVEEAHSSLN